MATEILAVGTTAANSSDVVVAVGAPLSVCLKDAGGPTILGGALVHILRKDDAGGYFRVKLLSAQEPSAVLDEAGTYRFSRVAGVSCGVFSDGGVAAEVEISNEGDPNDADHPLYASAVIRAGSAEIGKVNQRHINVLGAVLTRPTNVTAYLANESISDNSTAGSVTALTSNDLSDVNDDPIELTEILIDSPDAGVAGATLRIHLFNSNPTANSGVVGGDNAAWSNKKAGWFGSFSGVMRAFSDGSKGVLVPDEGSLRMAFPASGAKNIWYQLQTLSAFTPSANSTTFTPRFKGFQGRV